MLDDKLTKLLFDKLTYALDNTGVKPQYVFNCIAPIIESYIENEPKNWWEWLRWWWSK